MKGITTLFLRVCDLIMKMVCCNSEMLVFVRMCSSRRNTCEARTRTNNKLNPHVWHRVRDSNVYVDHICGERVASPLRHTCSECRLTSHWTRLPHFKKQFECTARAHACLYPSEVSKGERWMPRPLPVRRFVKYFQEYFWQHLPFSVAVYWSPGHRGRWESGYYLRDMTS